MNFIKRQPPGRLIAAGFALVILAGAALLMLPVSVRDGAQVTPIDALFTSTSAVCVTGLIAIDTADHFTVFGRTIVALLIQVGGLGVTSVGVGFILVAGKRVGFKSRLLVREAMNMENGKGIVRLVKSILLMTLCFEGAGALLSFLVFVQDHPPVEAIGISIFHSIAAFNNSGFDILGGLQNLIPYQNNLLLNLTTWADHFRRIGFSGYPRHLKKAFVPRAGSALQSRHRDERGIDPSGHAAFESDGKRHMAGRILSERFGQNGRFFHLSDRFVH